MRRAITTLPTRHVSISRTRHVTRLLSTIGGSGERSSSLAFDRRLKLLQRSGAARARKKWDEKFEHNGVGKDDDDVDYDYVRREVALRLVDRLDDINREGGFPLALDIGSGAGYVYRAICADEAIAGDGGIGGVRKLVQIDSCEEALRRDEGRLEVEGAERCGTFRVVADEEGNLAFPDGTFDLVMSSAAFHWVNDLPHLLKEVKRILKPDGCFMFAMIGGTTLSELRSSLVLSEMEREGGVSTHVGPFVDFSDIGTLLTNAGFTLPTVDIDTIKLAYPNAMVLMEHLQRMGEGNACVNRRERVGLDTFLATSCMYDHMYKLESGDRDGDDQSIEASVQIIYAIGWTPHESQPKPKERGSATHKVGDVVDVVETSTDTKK